MKDAKMEKVVGSGTYVLFTAFGQETHEMDRNGRKRNKPAAETQKQQRNGSFFDSAWNSVDTENLVPGSGRPEDPSVGWEPCEQKVNKVPFFEAAWNPFDEENNMSDAQGCSQYRPPRTETGEDGTPTQSTGFAHGSRTFPKSKASNSAASVKSKQEAGKTQKPNPQEKDFNLWGELEEASSKTVSRRDLLRGIFRFLPRDDD